jgi:WD40 repeat protein
MKWSPYPDLPKELLYSAGNVLVAYDPEHRKQRYFLGNTLPISCIEIAREGWIVVTAHEDKNPWIKIWDFKTGALVYAFRVQIEGVKSISISPSTRLLCIAGLDSSYRDILIIFDIGNVQNAPTKPPFMVAKQLSEFNILHCKFSPFENDKLVSCGKENIRFWRIKQQHLSGCPVVLDHHARNTIFTVLDFEFVDNFQRAAAIMQTDQQQMKRVFVGSKQGHLYIVNYFTRELEAVYRCHDSAICSLTVSAGFCVSGGEDYYLRVWPLDFSEFFMEAKHEGVVISLDVSSDGLVLASGTSTGGISLLDLSNQNYTTIMRAHTDEIIQLVAHEFSNSIISLSKDYTIRVWNMSTLEQTFEFSYPRGDECKVIAAHPAAMYFVAGFTSGVVRIFDIVEYVAALSTLKRLRTSMIEESKYHKDQIIDMKYSPDGRFLVAVDAGCFYCIYDVARKYQLIKTLDRKAIFPGSALMLM